MEKLIIFFDFSSYVVGAATDSFLVKLGIAGIGMQQYVSDLEMEEFLFYFGVHQNLIRNISFQKCFVDVTLKPLLTKELEDEAEGHNILALELLPRAHASLVVLLEA